MLSRISTVLCRGKIPIINKTSTFYEMHEIPPETLDYFQTSLKNIGDHTGIENLSRGSFGPSSFPAQGIIYGPNSRLMICLNCQHTEKSNAQILQVWFLADTGSFLTFLSPEAMEKLAGSEIVTAKMPIYIPEPKIAINCHPSHSHFKDADYA